MIVYIPVTLEDFDGLLIEVKAKCHYYPGEQMVRYYPDGGGYPGSPAEAEIESVTILEAFDDERKLSSDELEALRLPVEDYLDTYPELWYEEACDVGGQMDMEGER